jgi:Yip1-like protein
MYNCNQPKTLGVVAYALISLSHQPGGTMNPEISYASQSDKIEPEPTPQSFFNRLIGVYFSPGETFHEIGRAPRLLMPIIALVVLTLVGSSIVSSKMPWESILEQQVQRQIDSSKVTPEQGELQKEQMRKVAPFLKIATPLFITVYSIILALILAGVAKLVSLMFAFENNFKSLFSVAVYSVLAVSIISSILFIVLLFIKPVEDFDWENPLSSNLAALLSLTGMESAPGFLKTFFSYIDVFFIWKLVLLAIGFAAVSKKLKTSTALTWVVLIALMIVLGHSSWAAVFS